LVSSWQNRFRKTKVKAFLTDENSYYDTKVHVLKFLETDDSGNTIDKSGSAMMMKTDHLTLNDQNSPDNLNNIEENNEKNDKSMNVSEMEPGPTPNNNKPPGEKEDGDEKKADDIDPDGSVSSCNYQFILKSF